MGETLPGQLIRRDTRTWQRVFCMSVSVMLLLVTITLLVIAGARFRPELFGEIGNDIRQFSLSMGIYVAMVFIALAIMAWNLCLHDWATRGGKEKLIIGDNELSRIGATPLLSLATDLWSDFGHRRWRVARSDILDITAKIYAPRAGRSAIVIRHKNGKEVLFLADWVYRHSADKTEEFLRDFQWTGEALHGDKLKSIPLIQELQNQKYAIEFQYIK